MQYQNKIKSLLLLIMPLWLVNISAQDLHFTNNSIVPTFFNPAQTGAYLGNYRAGLIYRDQWRSNIPKPYQQAALFVDSPFMFGLSSQHWIGGGITIFYDKAGAPGQTWNGFYPGLSYHIGLDKKFTNVFTIGVQYGYATRDYNYNGWLSNDEELNLVSESPDRQNIQELKAGYSDLNVGILFKSKPDKFSKFEIGAAMMHLLNPKISFKNGGGISNIGRRLNAHIKYRRATTPQLIWEPSVWFSKSPGASNIELQLRNEYLLKKGGNFSIIGGLGYRLGDALQLLLGAGYKDYIFSLSYDQGVSGLGGELVGSAFELGVQKQFVVNKRPKVKPIIFCPRL